MASHHHLLLTQLLGHVLGAGAGHVDPGLAEEGEGAEHEGDVEDGVDWVRQHQAQRLWQRQVVAETANGVGAAAAGVIPDAEQVDDEVAGELDAEPLRDHVEVEDEGAVPDDLDVAGVEQLDGVAVLGRLDRQVDTKPWM